MQPVRIGALVCLFASTAVGSATAQVQHPLPHLGADADPRDANAYYELGIAQIIEHPDSAGISFWWASRLDPTWAEPIYSEWVALHLSNNQRFRRYVEGYKPTLESAEVLRIDSLVLRAYQINPFFFRRLTYLWNETYLRDELLKVRLRRIRADTPEQRNWVLDSLLRADTTTHVKAWMAYVRRQFNVSAAYYGRELEAETDPEERAEIQWWRGHIFFLANKYDSAQASFLDAAETLRDVDERDLVYVYRSKAMLYYCQAMALETYRRRQAAREAYAQALIEDLSFAPAHWRLARMSLAARDTVDAIAELQLATEADPSFVPPFVDLGSVRYAHGEYAAAAEASAHAIELEPYYADPWYWMGLAREALGDAEGAQSAYASFLGLAKGSDERRSEVQAKIRSGGL